MGSFSEASQVAYALGREDARTNVDVLMTDDDVRALLREHDVPVGVALVGAYRRGAYDFHTFAGAGETA